MDSLHPWSNSADTPSAAPSEPSKRLIAIEEPSPRSTWFADTFGTNPYPMMERLAPHRVLIVGRLDKFLAPAVLAEIKNASSDWDGIKVLALHLSHRALMDSHLRMAIEQILADLPEVEEQLGRQVPAAASSAGPSPSLPPAAVFPEPPVCEGRDNLIAEVVAGVTAQDSPFQSVILHGVGGIGKSTVALQVLHHLDVIAYFRGRRFFIGCENLSTLDDLVGRLMTQLAIDKSAGDAKAAICQFGMSSPALLVLDNFEDLWNADGPATEPFLSSIAKGVGFKLIVTKRGRSDLRLPRTRGFPIDALDRPAALHAFIRHADRDGFDVGADPDLPELVDRLDGYPLALMLLAHQYDVYSGVSAKRLLATYELRRSECLKRGGKDTRETNLQASVDLSLASNTMSAVGARELCFLLSCLPDGAEEELIDAFLARIASHHSPVPPDLGATQRAVIEAGLASVSAQGLLRMLAPLRELFTSLDGIAACTRADAHSSIHEHTNMLVALAQGIFNRQSAGESLSLRRRVTTQLGNLAEAIKVRLGSEDPSTLGRAVQNASQLAYFIRLTVPFVPNFLSLAVDRAHSSGLIEREAYCRLQLGAILFRTNQLGAARSHLRRAESLYQDLNHRVGKAGCWFLLGQIAEREDDLYTARTHVSAALITFEEFGRPMANIDAFHFLGELALRQGDLRNAETHYGNALSLSKEIGFRQGEAMTLKSLGHVAHARGDLFIAQSALNAALGIFTEISDRLNEANALNRLGDLALNQNDLNVAQSRFDTAIAIYKEIGDRGGEVNVVGSLGRLALRRGNHALAQAHLGDALVISEEIDYRSGKANALLSLGDLALQHDNLSSAEACFSDALAIYEEIGDRQGETSTLVRLGDFALRWDDLHTAWTRLHGALALSRELDYGWAENQSNRLLAHVAALANGRRRRIPRHPVDSAGRSFRLRPSRVPVLQRSSPPPRPARQDIPVARSTARRHMTGSSGPRWT